MSENALLFWGIGLLAASLALVALEVTLPTGGLLAIVSGGCAIGSVVCFFRVSTTWGMLGLLALLILMPTALAFGLKVWPHTPVGRRMILGGETAEEDVQRRLEARRQEEELAKALIGVRGTALTDLRPIGLVRIEGERIDALAEGGVIPAGSEVRVTAVEGSQIKVRRVV